MVAPTIDGQGRTSPAMPPGGSLLSYNSGVSAHAPLQRFRSLDSWEWGGIGVLLGGVLGRCVPPGAYFRRWVPPGGVLGEVCSAGVRTWCGVFRGEAYFERCCQVNAEVVHQGYGGEEGGKVG